MYVYVYIYIHKSCVDMDIDMYGYINKAIYIYIYATPPSKTYLFCSKYVPECPVFLPIFSPTVALHQESFYKLHVEMN